MITSFDGKYDFLSNFYPSPIWFEDNHYPTAEHAFQAMKTFNSLDREKILNAPTPGQAKRFGKKVELREDWEAVKTIYMYRIVKKKFSNRGLTYLLLSTGNAVLVEGNEWGDKFWGQSPLGEGYNVLGKILMMVREELR